MFTLSLIEWRLFVEIAVNNEFKNEVFSSYDPGRVGSCNLCGKKLAHVRAMLDPVTGRTVRMFRCECASRPGAKNTINLPTFGTPIQRNDEAAVYLATLLQADSEAEGRSLAPVWLQASDRLLLVAKAAL